MPLSARRRSRPGKNVDLATEVNSDWLPGPTSPAQGLASFNTRLVDTCETPVPAPVTASTLPPRRYREPVSGGSVISGLNSHPGLKSH